MWPEEGGETLTVLEERDKVGLGSFLKSANGGRLETDYGLILRSLS